MKKVGIYLMFCLSLGTASLSAQEVKDSVQIHFRVGKSHLDASWRDNRQALDRIADSLRMGYSDSIYRLQKIWVVGAASPEGSIRLNKELSEKRAETLFSYLSQYRILPDSLKTTDFIGRDWNGLLHLAEEDPKLPYREETLALLRSITQEANTVNDPLKLIQELRGGVPYRYMYRHLFPELRYSSLYLWYRKIQNPRAPVQLPHRLLSFRSRMPLPDSLHIVSASVCKPFYMAVKTNLLYDALFVPNVGVEFYLGKEWSLVANWMYAWWSNDSRHNYWRVYGGDIALRKWFGRKAEAKPLTGHHLGVYVQALTYDFELGEHGYMGGLPGGNIFDRANYVVGIEYGYSLPIASRLNLDFTIGLGYFGGEYREYELMDDCYVWQATKHRHYWGPTKAEVSLVWLIGRGNVNIRKGGKR